MRKERSIITNGTRKIENSKAKRRIENSNAQRKIENSYAKEKIYWNHFTHLVVIVSTTVMGNYQRYKVSVLRFGNEPHNSSDSSVANELLELTRHLQWF